jgi:hypothetical protein
MKGHASEQKKIDVRKREEEREKNKNNNTIVVLKGNKWQKWVDTIDIKWEHQVFDVGIKEMCMERSNLNWKMNSSMMPMNTT